MRWTTFSPITLDLFPGELQRDPKPCLAEGLHVLHIQNQVRQKCIKWTLKCIVSVQHIKKYQVHQLVHRNPRVPNSSRDRPRASHGCKLPRLLKHCWCFPHHLWVVPVGHIRKQNLNSSLQTFNCHQDVDLEISSSSVAPIL